ncbi:hypothetical protein ACLOJK_022630, partial [Asimina triloba]
MAARIQPNPPRTHELFTTRASPSHQQAITPVTWATYLHLHPHDLCVAHTQQHHRSIFISVLWSQIQTQQTPVDHGVGGDEWIISSRYSYSVTFTRFLYGAMSKGYVD